MLACGARIVDITKSTSRTSSSLPLTISTKIVLTNMTQIVVRVMTLSPHPPSFPDNKPKNIIKKNKKSRTECSVFDNSGDERKMQHNTIIIKTIYLSIHSYYLIIIHILICLLILFIVIVIHITAIVKKWPLLPNCSFVYLSPTPKYVCMDHPFPPSYPQELCQL